MPSDEGRLSPLDPTNPEALLSGLSETERTCLEGSVDTEQLMALFLGPEPPAGQDAMAFFDCLEQDTALRIFLGGIVGPGSLLSVESSACIREGSAGMDVLGLMLAAGEEDDAAIAEGMGLFVIALSCLNEEELQAASAALGTQPEEIENLKCVLEELGGPEGLVEALQPEEGEFPTAFFEAAFRCGASMMGPPGQ